MTLAALENLPDLNDFAFDCTGYYPVGNYAVTDGSFSGFATRVISRPARTATDNDNSVRISNSFISTFLHTSLYTLPSKMQEELVKNE